MPENRCGFAQRDSVQIVSSYKNTKICVQTVNFYLLPWLKGEGDNSGQKIFRNIFVKNLNFLLCRDLKVEGKIKVLKNISI